MSTRRLYDSAGEEPELLEVLADPIIHAVMRRDGVTMAELCSAIRLGKCRLGGYEGNIVAFAPPGWAEWRCPDHDHVKCA